MIELHSLVRSLANGQRSADTSKKKISTAKSILQKYDRSSDRYEKCDRPGPGAQKGGTGCITNKEVRSAIARLGGLARHGKYKGKKNA